MIDEIEKIILSNLGKNARMSSIEITRILHDLDYKITERAVRYRIKKLENEGIILGYSTILNPAYSNDKVHKLILIKFKIIKNTTGLVDRLMKHLNESSFCVYACKIQGEFDFICHIVMDSTDQFDLEIDNFIYQFSDLISDFRTFDSRLFKFNPNLSFDDHDLVNRKLTIHKILNSLNKEENIAKKLDLIVESVVKYFDAAFARIWILDENQKYLILKCSAGIYTNCHGEFSKVSMYAGKIGHVLRTKKPAISNDLSNDPRIKYPEWARKANLKSFAGFPLIFQNRSIGVLAMFSEKKLKPADFELIEIFCNDVSRQLSLFLEGQRFLFDKEQ
ncbi:GAF domain-containing protein [Candidatus Nitrosocosmicus hydrocola]|uniref:GAF domain-containing protein n=1 Tax=Candidatus Nitrosocosmicus hydrocola TaxID=1826872 RepID=UPI001372A623|nr:GAF domain-containing protein [Candidatus Nitrosocosmicus hydrocola]